MQPGHQQSRESWAGVLLPFALVLGLVLLLRLDPGPAAGAPALTSPLEPWLKVIVGYLAAGA